MLDEITPETFAEWQAFAALRPFGVLKRAEIQASLLAAQCVDVDTDDVLSAWGFDRTLTEADVMDEDESAEFVIAAFGLKPPRASKTTAQNASGSTSDRLVDGYHARESASLVTMTPAN